MRRRICFVITEDWYFWWHRLSLASFLVQQGHDVHLVTRFSNRQQKIESQKITTHSVGMQRTSRNPTGEAVVVGRMAGLFRKLKPDIVHLVGMKPILYGSVAARVARVPATVCAIAVLGWLFTPGGLLKSTARRVVSNYFRFGLAPRNSVRFIVQNSHHEQVLVKQGMARPEQVLTIAGAGVDTNRFSPQPEPEGVPTVTTHARMLWDKGIGDLVAAARIIRESGTDCQIQLIGDPDPANPASITAEQLKAWNEEHIVRWQGRRDDIPDLLAKSHIACLPSYDEGFPLSLVEALSCGRPVVTNDIPGCRDAVTHEKTGLLVPKGDVHALAGALLRLINDKSLRQRMGKAGRRDVMTRMSNEIVNQQTSDCYDRLLGADPTREEEAQPLRRAA